eukprot:1007318-Amphidinium_carterae.1
MSQRDIIVVLATVAAIILILTLWHSLQSGERLDEEQVHVSYGTLAKATLRSVLKKPSQDAEEDKVKAVASRKQQSRKAVKRWPCEEQRSGQQNSRAMESAMIRFSSEEQRPGQQSSSSIQYCVQLPGCRVRTSNQVSRAVVAAQ